MSGLPASVSSLSHLTCCQTPHFGSSIQIQENNHLNQTADIFGKWTYSNHDLECTSYWEECISLGRQADEQMWCHNGVDVLVSVRTKYSWTLVHCRHHSTGVNSHGCVNELWSWSIMFTRRGAFAGGSSWLHVSRANDTWYVGIAWMLNCQLVYRCAMHLQPLTAPCRQLLPCWMQGIADWWVNWTPSNKPRWYIQIA